MRISEALMGRTAFVSRHLTPRRAYKSALALLAMAAVGCSSESSSDTSPGPEGGLGGSGAAGGSTAGSSAGGHSGSGTGAVTGSAGKTAGGGGASAGGTGASAGGAKTSAGGAGTGAGGAGTGAGGAGTGAGGAGAGTGGTTGAGGTGSGGAKSTGGASATGGAGAGGAGTGGAGGASSCIGTKPDATNTGVPAGTTLTVVNGNRTITQDGATLDATDLHGFLVIQASNVKITRSIIRGGTATQNGDGIRVQSGTGILIEDTEVAIATPSAYIDGIGGSNFTVRRANIHGGVDGMKLGSNSTVECSYIHDMAYFASDPNQGGGPTHNDAIQILSGTGIRVTSNQLLSTKDQNSAIQVTQDFGVVGDLVIDRNWADGGGCTFNIAHKGAASLTGVTVTNNRFGRNSFYDCPILKSTQTTLTMSGNVYDNDGTAVPVQTHD